MLLYFSINVVLSLLMLTAVYLLSKAPFRQRFQLMLLALISWLLPYDMIAGALAVFETPSIIQPVLAFGESFQASVEPVLISQQATAFPWLTVLASITGVGLLWFVADLYFLKRNLNKQGQQATLYQESEGIRYYAVNGLKGAHTSGYFKPMVWFSAEYLQDEKLDSILWHERQHIRQHDQFWLLCITFIERLLWWNPVIKILSRQARQYIELSCDQACAQALGREQYQTDLASLIISANPQKQAALSNNVLGKKNFNIHRIQHLNQEYVMTKRNVFIFIMAIGLFISTFATTLLAKTDGSMPPPPPIPGFTPPPPKAPHAPEFHEVNLQENQILLTLQLEVGENMDDDPTTLDSGIHEARNFKMVANLEEWSEIEMGDYSVSLMPTALDDSTYQLDFIVDNQEGAIDEQRFPSIHVSKNKIASMIFGNEHNDQSLQVRLVVIDTEHKPHPVSSPHYPEKS